MHHGVMGMHWGIRRYQNEDGSLTSEGKIRYRTDEKFRNKFDSDKVREKRQRMKIASDLRNEGISKGAAKSASKNIQKGMSKDEAINRALKARDTAKKVLLSVGSIAVASVPAMLGVGYISNMVNAAVNSPIAKNTNVFTFDPNTGTTVAPDGWTKATGSHGGGNVYFGYTKK